MSPSLIPPEFRAHTYRCAVTGCTTPVDCNCEWPSDSPRARHCDPTQDWLCIDHEDWIRCDYCGEYVAAPAFRVGQDAYCPACEAQGITARYERGQRLLRKSRVYLHEMQMLTEASINALDAEDAARYATLAAHEAGYIAWVEARLKGDPQLAPISTRDPVSWTDYTRNRPLMP